MIYPAATRKRRGLSRWRMESTLLRPRAVFLTGATGYLGAHILAEMLCEVPDVACFCLVRAADEDAARGRLRDTLDRFQLLDLVLAAIQAQQLEEKEEQQEQQEQQGEEDQQGADEAAATTAATLAAAEAELNNRLVVVVGDLGKPLLGLETSAFKSLALEVDSIVHCGAMVNLVQPYGALRAANVFGTQEVLRLATTNGINMTKVKPVHYVSTNGIFPVTRAAYPSQQGGGGREGSEGGSVGSDGSEVVCAEDTRLDAAGLRSNLTEGYSMTKWVAERMCGIAEDRGLPVSVMRPGNMAGSSRTGVQNPDDFVKIFLDGVIKLGAAPLLPPAAGGAAGADADANKGSGGLGGADGYAFDLTPVDFAAAALVKLAVDKPHRAIGRRVHLQNPAPPVTLGPVIEGLRALGHTIKAMTRAEWLQLLTSAADAERQEEKAEAAKSRSSSSGSSGGAKASWKPPSTIQRLEAGWDAFEAYFTASTWMRYGSDNLVHALQGTGLACPVVDKVLLARWFPCGQ